MHRDREQTELSGTGDRLALNSLHMAIHGFVLEEFTKPVHERHLQVYRKMCKPAMLQHIYFTAWRNYPITRVYSSKPCHGICVTPPRPGTIN